jgi:dihydroneopterin aldolase
MVPLLPHPRLHALAPDPPATVAVRNHSTTLQHAGHDAWNRAHKPQPCLISASVAFLAPFSTAAAHDKLGGDTVHYGLLSKAVLGCVQEFDAELKKAAAAGMMGERERGVQEVLGEVWCELTGLELDGRPAVGMEEEKPVLDLGRVRVVSVTVGLPKGSLLGEGVSVTASAVFGEDGSGVMEARAMALEVKGLRVPTLVGVNANERLARQFVVVTVTVEGLTTKEDIYTEIEGDVVRVSAFLRWLFDVCFIHLKRGADYTRLWRRRRSRPSRRWAPSWQRLCWLRADVRRAGRSASAWRSRRLSPWRTVRLWKSARRQRLVKYSEGERRAHHRSSETGIYPAATSTQAVGSFIGRRAQPILARTKGHRRLSPP